MNENLVHIDISKRFYGAETALEHLDEEFIEFLPETLSYEKFFVMYNSNFYSISKKVHKYFLEQSLPVAFPNGYTNKLILEKKELKNQKKSTQREIDSLEKEHYYFNNHNFIMDIADEELSNGRITDESKIYYMQSGKKRQIKGENLAQTYMHLKTKKFLNQNPESIPDKNIIIFISTETLEALPTGPDIENIGSTNMSNLEINIYPALLEEYENEILLPSMEAEPLRDNL